MAAVMSMPLPLDNPVSSYWTTPTRMPAPASVATCRTGVAKDAACSRSRPAPPQARCWVSSSRPVNAAAASPVPAPVSTTASQKPAVRRLAKIGCARLGAVTRQGSLVARS